MNVEQGISNYEIFLSFGIHYSLFDTRCWIPVKNIENNLALMA